MALIPTVDDCPIEKVPDNASLSSKSFFAATTAASVDPVLGLSAASDHFGFVESVSELLDRRVSHELELVSVISVSLTVPRWDFDSS